MASKKSTFDTLQPAKVNLGNRDQPEAATENKQAVSTHVWMIVIAVLLLVAVFVIFALPSLVDQPKPVPGAAAQQEDAPAITRTPNKPKPVTNTSLPYRQTLADLYRQAAQQNIERIAEVQLELENLNVIYWAQDAFLAAQELAAQGDELFRNNQWQAAQIEYDKALQAMQALWESWPELLRDILAGAETDLHNNAYQQAREKLLRILHISPGHPLALAFEARLAARPQVLALLQESHRLQRTNSLRGALSQAQAAVAMDATFRPAGQRVVELQAKIQDQTFAKFMAEGLRALRKKEFLRAQKAFLAAKQTKPGPDPEAGIQEAKFGLKREKTQRLTRQAIAAERKEDWAEAEVAYASILKLNPNPHESQQKLQHALYRKTLDVQLEKLLDGGKLERDDLYEKRRRVLRLADKIRPKGPRLTDQLRRLQTAFELSRKLIQLTLTSDQQTSVLIYNFGTLGTFNKKEVKLTPGEYRMLGSKRGYRDVLHIFTIKAGVQPPPIDVRCEERI